jgi:hypothetical protein
LLSPHSDNAVYWPPEFRSRADQANTLRHLLPDIVEGTLPLEDNLAETRIRFAAQVNVNDSQLQLAGAKDLILIVIP